jgi:hypothetical protein
MYTQGVHQGCIVLLLDVFLQTKSSCVPTITSSEVYQNMLDVTASTENSIWLPPSVVWMVLHTGEDILYRGLFEKFPAFRKMRTYSL